ncbi:MAG: DUF2288 domain-containing protein [Ectothiorhodospiraceae bacterium]
MRTRLNAETAQLSWAELERHFARGAVVRVSADLDLVEVASRFAEDDRPAVERWLTAGEVRRTTVEDAEDWGRRDPALWAVVVAPWVLVQEPV